MRSMLAALLGLTVFFGGLQAAQPAHAAGDCATQLVKAAQLDSDDDLIVLVHGLNSDETAWGDGSNSKSIRAQLDNVPNTHLETFDYKSTNTNWVTNDNIGPRLAKRIACMAEASRSVNGSGKVIAIGHSMGGLAIREASSHTIDNRKVSDMLKFVGTVGTPNTGSGFADFTTNFLRTICPAVINPHLVDWSPCDVDAVRGLRNNSPQINALPKVPDSVPLLAIGGDETIRLEIGWAHVDTDTNSDVIVTKESALQNDHQPDQGGGQKNFECMAVNKYDGECWHNGLTSYQKTIDALVDAISKKRAYDQEQKRLEAEHKQLAKALKPFIDGGPWRVHGMYPALTIKSDGTGSYSTNAGPCNEDPFAEGGPMCNEHVNLKFKDAGNGKIHGTVTAKWVTDDNGTSYPVRDTSRSVGSGFTLSFSDDRHILNWQWDDAQNNSSQGILCDLYASQRNDPNGPEPTYEECGA
jgi:pimeloyl-ACP methyl ester carboxylesterase